VHSSWSSWGLDCCRRGSQGLVEAAQDSPLNSRNHRSSAPSKLAQQHTQQQHPAHPLVSTHQQQPVHWALAAPWVILPGPSAVHHTPVHCRPLPPARPTTRPVCRHAAFLQSFQICWLTTASPTLRPLLPPVPQVPPEDAGGPRHLHQCRLRQRQAHAPVLLVRRDTNSTGPPAVQLLLGLAGRTPAADPVSIPGPTQHTCTLFYSTGTALVLPPCILLPDTLPTPNPTYSNKCLRNRHGEDGEAAAASGSWWCPCCRKSCGPGCVICCNCGPCRKKVRGPPVTVIHTCAGRCLVLSALSHGAVHMSQHRPLLVQAADGCERLLPS
jgi:hypothetical protein